MTKIQSRPPDQMDAARIDAMLRQGFKRASVGRGAPGAAASIMGMLCAFQLLGHVESYFVFYSDRTVTVELVVDGVDHSFDYSGH